MMNKLLAFILFALPLGQAWAEKIKVKFDERTNTEKSSSLAIEKSKTDMSWFYANSNKERLLLLPADEIGNESFANQAWRVNSDVKLNEDIPFVLPSNILLLTSDNDLYNALLNPIYYSSYFN